MNGLNNIKTQTKLLASFSLVVVIIIIVAVVGYLNMKSINDGMTSLYKDRTLPIEQVGAAETALYKIRGDIYKLIIIPEEKAAALQSIEAEKKIVKDNIGAYKASFLVQEEKDAVAAFDQQWAAYVAEITKVIANVDAGKNDLAINSLKSGGAASNARQALGAAMTNIVNINTRIAGEINTQGDVTFANSTNLLLAIAILGVLLAIGLAIIISRSITVPLGLVVKMVKALAVGDLVRDMDDRTKDSLRLRGDEIGDIGRAFDDLINYMQDMGQAAGQIAENDLTATIQPKSDSDELGNAFVRMIASLREAVSKVAQSAGSLSSASTQLASAASQAGEATTQIARTVQQVAKGTQDQTQSVTKTATSVDQMAKAIDGVARGAQDQAEAIARASAITGQISKAIQQVAGNAAAVTSDSANAAEAARGGVMKVEETLEGMQNIKVKVGLSSQKVQEMGSRSDQIGAIVETIDDIASQTNLLALNAAIEAARAGEHGKGFAVVADEVRKLAERSSLATKEIGSLITGIQKTVAEAVKAMQEGAKEVEVGVRRANEAGDALSAILNAAEAVNRQAKQAAEASAQMSKFSNELVSAVESVSAVVEENTAATEEMAAGSTEVSRSIETIAAVSEENSAAIEEVSASAEEMSAQVEEVTASAASLAEMAQALQEVVSIFKLGVEASNKRAVGPVSTRKPPVRKPDLAYTGHMN